jgi:hypothetical protein
MPKWPRFKVVAVAVDGERYAVRSGWVEIRQWNHDLRSWEARCEIRGGWSQQDLTGSTAVAVTVEIQGGGELRGRAYVDQAGHLWGFKRDDADLKIHGTEFGLHLKDWPTN